eukprot:792907-Amphidinium_carterae.2
MEIVIDDANREESAAKKRKEHETSSATIGDVLSAIRDMKGSMDKRLDLVEDHQRGMSKRMAELESRVTSVESARKTPPKPGRASAKASSPANTSRGSGDSVSEQSEKTTMVIGGFPTDTKRSVVMETLPLFFRYVSATEDPVDFWAPNLRGSIGLAKFTSSASMWSFIKKARSKASFTVGEEGKTIWVAVSRTKEERDSSSRLKKIKELVMEVGKVEADQVEIDFRRQEVWLKDKKILECRQGKHEVASDRLESLDLGMVGIETLKVQIPKLLSEC